MATATSVEAIETVEDLLETLGGIDPKRVRIKPVLGTATEADLIAVNARKQGICELVDGVLVEKAMGFTESVLAGVILAILRGFIVPRNLGLVSGADGMLRLFPGLVREPDVSYISWERIPGGKFPSEPIGGFAPDLAVEVLSVSNTRAEMARKRREYFEAGVRLVWEVDPRARTVAAYASPEQFTLLDAAQTLDGGEVLPGFALPLSKLFAELDRVGA
ncbi:Uma2 family endonuclease [Tundrisphaera lichenicola]|uniref:Uma2 family endonuclease n=1 Tax=Tundrisphaera lichenicola TaxID=2029860 RepID=UPI003EB93A40